MRVWVRSEYAPELAVVFAWFAALIPWNVTLSQLSNVGTVLFVRFPLFQVRYAYGIPLAEGIVVKDPYSAWRWQFRGGATIAEAYAVWVAGAALIGAALVLSLAMYFREETTTRRLRRPVQIMGGLLALGGVAHALATVLLSLRGFPGVPVPVGVVFEVVFGGLLLGAERV